MANYKVAPEAEEDLYRIWCYGLHRFGEAQADKYYRTLFKHFEIIAENPYLFPSADHIWQGYRRCVVGADSIYYRIDAHTVEIMAIMGRQDFRQ